MLCNSSGKPVATSPMTLQIDAPCEQGTNIGTPNWGAVIAAGIQLIFAVMSGDQTKIAVAIQALIAAIIG